MKNDPPVVVAVRNFSSFTFTTTYWRIYDSWQREYFIPKHRCPDELSAYMEVTRQIQKEQSNDQA